MRLLVGGKKFVRIFKFDDILAAQINLSDLGLNALAQLADFIGFQIDDILLLINFFEAIERVFLRALPDDSVKVSENFLDRLATFQPPINFGQRFCQKLRDLTFGKFLRQER